MLRSNHKAKRHHLLTPCERHVVKLIAGLHAPVSEKGPYNSFQNRRNVIAPSVNGNQKFSQRISNFQFQYYQTNIPGKSSLFPIKKRTFHSHTTTKAIARKTNRADNHNKSKRKAAMIIAT